MQGREYMRVRAVNVLIKAAIVRSVLYSLWLGWKGAMQDHKAHYNVNLLQIVPCHFNVY